MNRRQKIFASAAVPAVLAIGVATGVAFAQMPGDHHDDDTGAMEMHQAMRSGAMDMGQMMQSGAMQDHMKEVLGAEVYAQMLEAMGNHASGMPMAMDDMNTMMTAMAACLGTGEMPGAPAGEQHSEHHPATATP